MTKDLIPWAQPHFWGKEVDYVNDALHSTWISGGPYVDRLERELSGFCATPHALVVSNGTAALHLAYLAIGLKAGDEVIVPGFGFLAAANVALHFGARPVFSEVDERTWCMTADGIERLIGPRTRAVVPVHTYGNACDMDAINELCQAHGLIVIEDAAESFATKYKGRQTGSIGDLGTFSFQATKTITTGEGGAVLCRREEWVEPLKLYRSHGMLRTRYLHEVAGLNFRLTNLQAAMGCAQLEEMEAIARARGRMHAAYHNQLKDQDGIALQSFEPTVDPVVWAIGVLLDPDAFPQGRDAVMAELMELGIESRPGFYSPTSMPHLYKGTHSIPLCDRISQDVISLPSFPQLTIDEITRICDGLKRLRRRA